MSAKRKSKAAAKHRRPRGVRSGQATKQLNRREAEAVRLHLETGADVRLKRTKPAALSPADRAALERFNVDVQRAIDAVDWGRVQLEINGREKRGGRVQRHRRRSNRVGVRK